jgi:type IV pilus assembly protein PilV
MEKNDGFTILEVLMTSVIFAIGILGVCALQTAAIKTISSANCITVGTTHAQDKLEELLELPFSDSDLSIGDHTESNPPYTITWIVAANSSSSKSVAVTSSWKNINGMSTNSRLNFIKYNW